VSGYANNRYANSRYDHSSSYFFQKVSRPWLASDCLAQNDWNGIALNSIRLPNCLRTQARGKEQLFVYIHYFVRDSMHILMGLFMCLSLLPFSFEAQAVAHLLRSILIFCLRLLGIPILYQLRVCLLGFTY